MQKSKNPVISLLELQKQIFGDDLFMPLPEILKVQPSPHQAVTTAIKSVHIDKNTGEQHVQPVNQVEPEMAHEPDNITENYAVPSYSRATNLDELNDIICNCQHCVLGSTRKKFVFGVGNPDAKVMLIGEGPGAEEDIQGEPFVGRAGQLLTDILKAINFSRQEVYIANIVKCRPPGNRTPVQEEIDACFPYLAKQIELIKPTIILCLGSTAATGLLKKRDTLGHMRQKVFEYSKIPVMVTYHPAALLRNPGWKRDCWEDVKAFRALYDKLIS
ncbi:MAG: uracil-DNA glycosylase [Ignavibacteria bacterium]|nr:uracil-DNA glycosylase [Ignavibacteria bacterium]